MADRGNQRNPPEFVVSISLEMKNRITRTTHHICQQFFLRFIRNVKLRHPQKLLPKKKARFERALMRKSRSELVDPQVGENNTVCKEAGDNAGGGTRKFEDFSCQTNLSLIDDTNDESFIFECTHNSNHASVQAKMGTRRPSTFKSSCDKKVGPDPKSDTELKCRGFHGHKSLKDDEQLSSISGVTGDIFELFLYFLDNGHGNERLNVKDKLLLFLMKMKLGVSYCALGVLFGIHRTTVANIFLTILSILADRIGNYVFWPNKL